MSPGTAKPATWPMCRGPLAYGHAGATKIVFDRGEEDIVLHHTSRFLGACGRPRRATAARRNSRDGDSGEADEPEEKNGQRRTRVAMGVQGRSRMRSGAR